MVYTGQEYKDIMLGDHRFEHEVRIRGHVYHDDAIASLKITGGLFSENRFSFGGCFARSIDIELYPSPYAIPRMASIYVSVRVVNDTEKSIWVPVGEFYIDTRETNDLGLMHITGYDAMLKAEKIYIDPGDVGQWPKKMSEVAEDIASKMGVGVGTSYVKDYDVQLPTGYTMREVLSFIAAASAGNWIISPNGRLELITLSSSTGQQSIGRNIKEFETGTVQSGWTRVIVNTGDDTYVEAGDETGETFEVFCPWGTTEMAQYILNQIANYKYRPYEARGAIIDPALEIGDSVNIDGTVYLLASIETTHDALCAADISAPTDNEIDHEYPYISSLNRQIKRRLQTIETTLYVGPESIIASVKDIDGRITQVSQTADKINWLVASGESATDFTMTDRAISQVADKIDLTGYVTFKSLTVAGSTAINGANITTGMISAERINVSELKVQKIYSNTGDVVIDARFNNTVVIGGDLVGWPDAGEIRLTAPVVRIGYSSVLEIDSGGRTISGGEIGWELGGLVYPFKCIYSEKVVVGTSIYTAELTAGNGKLFVNGSEVLTGSLEISAIKSGSYSLTISSNEITPSSQYIKFGTAYNYFQEMHTKELLIHYSSGYEASLTCDSSGNLSVGTNCLPTKSGSYALGSTSYIWNYLYVNTIRIYNGYNYVELACNYNGQLTAGGSVVATT